ncbi:DNA primase [Candidatus Uhrbacteria bacterium RIFCSPLOWO2_02_FULL_51_9]|uniref:DNA primase n=1 Tax=Candidatus Uhrbacteria bacterium RIFCSPLOWO2_02_FULL_51_9 TaxID=1802410 RepID=A0A1F7VFP5_9BACT|nr:MAG: DNA primase [Candidatus Uhrbacteria bacterium RIFCSPLOWO2_02_FULL_51_9]
MSDVDTIKERLDIAELVGEYLPLKQAGAYFKARCPFHQEKTPSFIVTRERQMWHCFGCNKGGDAFAFVQEMEGLSFPEALRLLAEKAGVQLTQFARREVNTSQKNRVLDILAFAREWFHQGFLRSPRAADARAYIAARGVPTELVSAFGIGFVPDEWGLLTRALLHRGFGIEDCIASGLTLPGKQGGGYDRFRGRVMFPIADAHGTTVGFTGRLLVEKEDAGGKYVNTPQTLAYDKGSVLYGLSLAKQALREKKYALIVEGQMDLIACHKAGTSNVVASSGTALTPDQLRLLKRYTQELRIAFDMDSAGLAAASRGVELALAAGFDVKVIIPGADAGKDPDECIQKNPALWHGAVAGAKPFMSFFIDHAMEQAAGGSIRDVTNALAPALKMIAVIPSAIERGFWIHRIAEQAGMREDDLRAEVARVQTRPQGGVRAQAPAPERGIVQSPSERRVERTLALALRYPKIIDFVKTMPESIFGEKWLPIFRALVVYYGSSKLRETLTEERKQLFDQLHLLSQTFDFAEGEAVQEAHILSEALRNGWLEKERKNLIVDLKAAEAAQDPAQVMRLLEQLRHLI